MRPVAGDGHAETRHLDPCRCPNCKAELIITCPNACENAADGASGYVDPVAMLPKPRGRARKIRTEKPPRERKYGMDGTGTSGRIMAWLQVAEAPMSAPDLAAKLDAPVSRISVMLGQMLRRGEVQRVARGQYEAA